MCSEKPHERPKLTILKNLEASPLTTEEKLVVCLPGRQIQHYQKEYREVRQLTSGSQVILVESLLE